MARPVEHGLDVQLVLWYGFMTPLTKGPFTADVARLRVRIRELRFDEHPPRLPHIQVRLGHRVYTSPKRALEGPWTDVYDLELSLHEHLFYTLQVALLASCKTTLILPRLMCMTRGPSLPTRTKVGLKSVLKNSQKGGNRFQSKRTICTLHNRLTWVLIGGMS